MILGADIRTIEDPKRSFTFSLMCKGVPEMYFSSEDENTLVEWFSKLAAASNAPDNCMYMYIGLKFFTSKQTVSNNLHVVCGLQADS